MGGGVFRSSRMHGAAANADTILFPHDNQCRRCPIPGTILLRGVSVSLIGNVMTPRSCDGAKTHVLGKWFLPPNFIRKSTSSHDSHHLVPELLGDIYTGTVYRPSLHHASGGKVVATDRVRGRSPSALPRHYAASTAWGCPFGFCACCACCCRLTIFSFFSSIFLSRSVMWVCVRFLGTSSKCTNAGTSESQASV